ncbi:hypothetical protein BV911_06280 [Pseudoruegeria sp. SK021]|nr:hypothetical protein BV911_06280 [Pseudoruegeria sp. SK021]
MIRPEVWAKARNARELLVGAAIALVGLIWMLNSFALGRLPGVMLGLLGCAIAFLGVQRLRFRVRGDGPGVVQVTEAQVAYFGPLEGGVVALDQLRSLHLDPTGTPLHWCLRHDAGPDLHIPVTAKGAEALFDAFSQLPDIHTERMLRALNAPGRVTQIVWQRPAKAQTASSRLIDLG